MTWSNADQSGWARIRADWKHSTGFAAQVEPRENIKAFNLFNPLLSAPIRFDPRSNKGLPRSQKRNGHPKVPVLVKR
jgi:hypothetical protein